MAKELFQALRDEVVAKTAKQIPAEKRAMFWFRQNASALVRWQQGARNLGFNQLVHQQFTKELISPSRAFPGFFYFYMYDAKWADKLPYWDRFPFTLVLDVKNDRFLGLNFHYLDYYYRAMLFDVLYPLRMGRNPSVNEDRSQVRDIRMRLKVSYEILQSASKYKAFRPCIKEYLVDHVDTPLMKVGAKEWDLALFLPIHQFEKRSPQYVWKRSQAQF